MVPNLKRTSTKKPKEIDGKIKTSWKREEWETKTTKGVKAIF